MSVTYAYPGYRVRSGTTVKILFSYVGGRSVTFHFTIVSHLVCGKLSRLNIVRY